MEGEADSWLILDVANAEVERRRQQLQVTATRFEPTTT